VTPYHDILYNHALIISKVRYRIEHTFSSLFLYNLKHILANSFEDDLERKIYRTKLSASERQVICLTLIYYVKLMHDVGASRSMLKTIISHKGTLQEKKNIH
jgi:hypothetical protein